MDYTGILNEKENQIVELEKKIQNLEERLRRASKRENELEDEIVRLRGALKAVNNANVTKADI
jgi:chromosome segregation ATPase